MDIVELRKEWVPFFESIKNEEIFHNFLSESNHANATALVRWLEHETSRICWMAQGETRAVFGTYDDVVFKFPLFDVSYSDGNDYCKMEVRHYRAAKKAGLDNLFAACDILCHLKIGDGYYPIYVMEYAESDGEENLDNMSAWFDENVEEPDPDDEALYESYEVKSNEVTSGSCEGVALYLKGVLGDELYDEFDEFCFKNDITDLHNENFGYICGRPVMIDYAGFGNVFDDLPANWFSEFGL